LKYLNFFFFVSLLNIDFIKESPLSFPRNNTALNYLKLPESPKPNQGLGDACASRLAAFETRQLTPDVPTRRSEMSDELVLVPVLSEEVVEGQEAVPVS
jgi:hypothetical protein